MFQNHLLNNLINTKMYFWHFLTMSPKSHQNGPQTDQIWDCLEPASDQKGVPEGVPKKDPKSGELGPVFGGDGGCPGREGGGVESEPRPDTRFTAAQMWDWSWGLVALSLSGASNFALPSRRPVPSLCRSFAWYSFCRGAEA